MWYYLFVVFIILGALFTAGINTAYHPHLIIKKYFRIKSSRWQRILVFKSNPCDCKLENKKEYQDRILVLGVVCYVLWIAVTLFAVGFLCFGPATDIEPFEFDDGFYISTLNKAVVFMVCLIFLGFEIAFYCLNISKSDSVKANKVIYVIWRIVVLFLFIICFCAILELLKIIT